MKRVIAVSDSHGSSQLLRQALEQAISHGKVDLVVFLGDGASDFEKVRDWLQLQGIGCHAVKGNNDWSSQNPLELTFTVNGVRFYACHGHSRNVKYGLDRLVYAAMEHEAKVALFGHTHREYADVEYGIELINPGAVCNASSDRVAYADIRVENNGFVQIELCKWA